MSNLKNIIESDVKEKIVVIDGHNLIFRTLFISEKHNDQFGIEGDQTYSYWKYIFLKTIVNTISTFNPTKLIICMDEKNTWRKDVYPEYKAQRKAARDNSKIDFKVFFPIMDAYYTDMMEIITNIMYLKVDRCEGDDIMAVISRSYPDANIELISTDKDLNQLLKRKNVKQYDPVKRAYTNSLNPVVDLEMKIITGDKGDNIPAIKPKCGPATAAKILTENLLPTLLKDKDISDAYDRNRILIDLDCIPKTIVDDITNHLNSYTLKSYDGKKFFNFAIKHRLASMIENIQEINSVLSTLDDYVGTGKSEQ
jgi:5'-3' exonuclease